jgi:RNA polymerase sigma-70 factor (ECF subfamily)
VAFWDDAAQRRPHLTRIASPATPLRDPGTGSFITIRFGPRRVCRWMMTASLATAAPRPLAPRGWSSLAVVLPESMSDEDLLERVARERDQSAFEVLYQRYARAVYSLVSRILRDRHTGEDVAQEAFAAVWRAAAGYHRGRGSAAGWMFAIARNAAIDASRAKVPLVVGELPDRPDPSPLPDAQAISDMEAFRVHLAVDSLPDREREVIELAYFSGLAQSEIAQQLELPLGTVKTRTRSALQRMAPILREEVGR